MTFDMKEYDRVYRLKNKEKIKERRREYYLKNKERDKEKIKERSRLYHLKNKEKEKEYCIKNREHLKKYKKEYNKSENGQKINRISGWQQRGVICEDFDKMYDIYINTNKKKTIIMLLN